MLNRENTNRVIYKDLSKIDYKEAWDYQQELLKEVIDLKLENRLAEKEGKEKKEQKHYLLFCEHPHVYTLGRNGKDEHLLLDEKGLEEYDATYYKINRGGDITYHGQGQLVGYPIFDLECFFTDIGKYIRFLEEVFIRVCAEYGLVAGRVEGQSGVWLDWDNDRARKICAIGVHLSRWVTMHGFAFNVNTDLSYFTHIVPCGITDKGVTSLQQELGRGVDMEEVKNKALFHFQNLFSFILVV